MSHPQSCQERVEPVARGPCAVAVSTLIAVLVACHAGPSPPATVADGDALRRHYDAHDYFALRDRLVELEDDGSPDLAFYRAAMHHVFNKPTESNRLLDELLATRDLDPELRREARRIRRDNHLRLHDYRAALAASREILDDPEEEDTEDAQNVARLLEAIADVPAQQSRIRGPSVLQLDRESETGVRLRLTIDGEERRYLFDTGANYSVLMRSEAESLGLIVRPAGVEVGNSVGGKIEADLAVADRLTIGNIDYRHVIFLVFPDELLSFPAAGVSIPGIVGFPVMEAMGEVRFRDGVLEIPESVPSRAERNLAFEQLEPLLRVGFGEDWLICRFDTGATSTEFYAPFFRRYRELVESRGTRRLATTAGVGEQREIDAWVLPEATLRIGDEAVTLDESDVYPEPLTDEPDRDPDDEHIECNLGQDALDRFEEYIVNFRSMSLVLRKPRDTG